MKTKISVTKTDIKNGVKESCNNCPIALAIKRKLKIKYIHVDNEIIHDGITKKIVFFPPEKCNDFINNFDKERKVKPFTFYLEVN